MNALPMQDFHRSLAVGTTPVRYVCVAAALAPLGGSRDALPYSLRILVENVARHQGRLGADASAALRALAGWPEIDATALPLFPSRVILPDSSGLPVLLDLAAMRDALARAGGAPARATSSVPIELIVDHSLQVDHAGAADAAVRNIACEFERNDERYRF